MASEPFHEEGPPLASQPNNTGTTAPPPPLAPPRAAAGRPERSVPPGPAKPAPLPPRASLGGAAGACGGATLPLLPLLRPVAVPAANGASPRVLQHWTAAGVVAAQSSLGQLLAAARPPQLKPAAAAATTGVLQPATPAAAATVGVVAVPPPALTTQLPVSVLGSKRKADAAMGHTVPLLRPRDVPAVGVPMLPHPVAAAAMPVIGQPIGLVGAGLPSLFQPPAWRGGSEAGSGGAASSDDDEAAAGRGWVKGQASEAAIAADAAAALERQGYRKARLTWTQELHNRFINALSHLGLKNTVPKSILAMMNVEGMTRENVASHLQKYRLYLHRLSGLSNKDHADTDTLQCLHEQNVQAMAAQQMMQQSLVAMQGQPAASVAASIDGPAPSVGTLANPVPLMAPQAGSSFSNGSAAAAASSGLASLAAAALGPPPAAAGAAGVAGCSSNSARPMLAAGTAGVNGTVAAAGPTPPRLLPLPGSQPALVAVQPKAAGTPLAIVPGHGNPAWNGQHNAGTAATASLVVAAAVRSAIPAGSTLAGMASGPPKSNGTTCTHLLVPVTGADSRGRDIAKTSAACPTNPTE